MSIEARRRAAADLTQPDSVATNRPKFKADPFWRHWVDQSPARWEAKLVPQIVHLSEFEAGWDGYHAPPLSSETCMFAIKILNNIMRPATPCPQVVPTSSGHLQLEWHEHGIDLEVRISGAYKCDVYFEDSATPGSFPQELPIDTDLSALIGFVDELTRR